MLPKLCVSRTNHNVAWRTVVVRAVPGSVPVTTVHQRIINHASAFAPLLYTWVFTVHTRHRPHKHHMLRPLGLGQTRQVLALNDASRLIVFRPLQCPCAT